MQRRGRKKWCAGSSTLSRLSCHNFTVTSVPCLSALCLLSFSLGKFTLLIVFILFWTLNSTLHFWSTFLHLCLYLSRFMTSWLESFRKLWLLPVFLGFFPSYNICCDYNIGISDKIMQGYIRVTSIGICSLPLRIDFKYN